MERLNASQLVLSASYYDAWGGRVYLSSKTTDPYGYDGQWGYYTGGETGLLLLSHRYYDPSEGRFVNRDPIGYEGGVNLYGYVGNEPVMGVDPSGEIVKFCWRPVKPFPPEERFGHWFLYDPKCGCLGYGPGGVMIEKNNNCKGNKAGFGPNNGLHCTVLPVTPRQEYCLCEKAKNAQNGGLVGGLPWYSGGHWWWYGHYNVAWHSCQDFVKDLLGDCHVSNHLPPPDNY